MATACIALCIGLPRAQANIIDATHGIGAGSFELGVFVPSGLDYMTLSPSSTTITGWTVGGPGDGVDWVTEPSYNAYLGTKAVDLQSTSLSSIQTTIPTAVGANYLLSFWAASVGGYTTNGVVSAGSLVNQPFAFEPSGDFPTQNYTPFSFSFTAVETTTTVKFQAAGTDTAYGPVIDNVSVSGVPEPSAGLLFAFAGGLLALRRGARR